MNRGEQEQTPHQLLVAARAVLAENGWCQRAMARNSKGEAVFERSRDAVSFCAMGAIQKAGGVGFDAHSNTGVLTRRRLRNAISQKYGLEYISIDKFNDAEGRTKEEVLAAFDVAIKMGEAG